MPDAIAPVPVEPAGVFGNKARENDKVPLNLDALPATIGDTTRIISPLEFQLAYPTNPAPPAGPWQEETDYSKQLRVDWGFLYTIFCPEVIQYLRFPARAAMARRWQTASGRASSSTASRIRPSPASGFQECKERRYCQASKPYRSKPGALGGGLPAIRRQCPRRSWP